MRMTVYREKRLTSAQEWLKTYSGKNLVGGYAKRYGVDKLCAVIELHILGVDISQEYKVQLVKSIDLLKRQRLLRKAQKELELNSSIEIESDDNFAFIAGYTSGGVPYGITHEEMDKIKNSSGLE